MLLVLLSGTTLSEIGTATGNGWDLSMYADATSYDGWTTSADDFNSYYDCHGSYDSLTGGLDSCDLSLEDWNAVNALASASSADDLTSDDLEGIISASGTTDNSSAFGDLTNLTSLESDYIKDCMGSTVTSSALTTCVTSATSTSVPIFKIAQKVSGDLSGAITVSELQNTGLETLETQMIMKVSLTSLIRVNAVPVITSLVSIMFLVIIADLGAQVLARQPLI